METVPTIHTLLDDWQWRRDRLNRIPGGAPQFVAQQIKVLDYLIRRYHDSPEAQRSVPAMPRAEFHVDQRAIVVLHHVWEGKVGGIKSLQEGESRVSAIVKRIAAHASIDESETSGTAFLTPDAPDADAAIAPPVWSDISRWIPAGFLHGDAAIVRGLAKSSVLSPSAAQHLYLRIVGSGPEEVRAAELLVQGRDRTAINYVVHAWRELVGSGRRTKAWQVLNRFLASPEPAAAVAEGVRDSLAHNNPHVRLAALDILVRIGTLEDIGLLSDLLALPLAADEHPDERAALIRTMRSIAETTR